MRRQNNGNSLLLGMVFATEQKAKRGQEYRDRVRCEALENIGYKVRTLDNKHADKDLEKHCTANFSDTRRMMRAMEAKWADEKFDHVILDYFFSPVGWARERWTDPLFTKTFPTLAQSGMLSKGCKIWLPNLQCIEESLSDFKNELAPFYIIRKERNPKMNPLYLATENVERELLMCPDALTNETQLRPLLNFSEEPFYVLELRAEFLTTPATPPRAVRANSAAIDSASSKKRKLAAEVAAASGNESSASDSEDKVKVSRNKKQAKTLASRALGRQLILN